MATKHVPPPNVNDYGAHMLWMQDVMAEIREIPEHPSEQVKDSSAILDVVFPEDGGVHTVMDAYRYPFQGFPIATTVEAVDVVKKVGRAVLSGLYHESWRVSKWKLLLLIPSIPFIGAFIRTGVYVFYRRVARVLSKRERYAPAIHELWRAFSIERIGEDERERGFRLQLRDLTCMILEYDNAYRFRFQDVVAELNKDALKKHPRREMLRLLGTLQERERQQDLKDTWTLLKIGVVVCSFADRKLYRLVQDVLMQLHLGRIGLTTADRYFCAPRVDYRFPRFAEVPEDAALAAQSHLDQWYREERQKLRDEERRAPDELAERHKAELRAMAPPRTTEEKQTIFARIDGEKKRLWDEFTKAIEELEVSPMSPEQLARYHTQRDERLALERAQDEKQKALKTLYEQRIAELAPTV